MTSTPVTLGIDLGTTGVKAVALDEGGRTVAQASRTYPLLTPYPGWTEQRPEDWVAAALDALKDLAQQLRDARALPLALGLSGQMHGAVFLGAGGEVLRPALLWNDQRTGKQVQAIEVRIPRTDLIARTGNRAVTGFQLPKVLWLRDEEPEVFARLAHVLLPKDYLGFVLTGEMRTEPSDASGVGALNLACKAWDREVLQALELSPRLFPEVVNSWDVVGRLKAELSAYTELPAGLPVVAGGGDNAAAGIALGLTSDRPRVGSVSLGTSGVLFAPLAQPTPDPQGRVHLFAHADGGYNLLGVTLACAGALQWLHDKLAPDTSFDLLLSEAAKVPDGAQGVTFLPYLAGERSPHMNPELRGAWTGLALAHGRGHLTRALLEGTALALADTYEVMRPLSSVNTFLATGGGARSDFWLGLVAGALDVQVERSTHEPGAADGAALLAMPSAGIYRDLAEVMQALRPAGTPVRPLEITKAREQHSSTFARLYGAVQPEPQLGTAPVQADVRA
ncbi:xylulokinase [Deinococcus sp. YIM 77859]|uniref:xylulokinase n=1 Tax=Deinococcus sp. YIM 77859 TaxID=1540221 RepID=UPI00068A09E1|nr:xylulokinase [Deinococcus sp. YIM 77859]